MPQQADPAHLPDDIDWITMIGCLAIGFLAGVAAHSWWSRKVAAAEEKEDSTPRIAETFPF